MFFGCYPKILLLVAAAAAVVAASATDVVVGKVYGLEYLEAAPN